MTVPEAFAQGLQHHQCGRLAEAEAIYRQILAVEPGHADALHLLGVIARQMGRSDLALDMIARAIALNPVASGFHCNLGNAFKDLGKLDEAIAEYREALALRPDFPEAWVNLGTALSERGQFEEAMAACRGVIRLQPDSPEACNVLGHLLREHGDLGEAVAWCRRAIQLKPDFPEAHNNLGFALRDQGHIEEAIASYRRAIALRPDYAEAHNNLGNALGDQGHLESAIAALRRALELAPDHAGVRSNLLLGLHYLPGFDPEEMAREHRRWEEVHARPLAEFIVPHHHVRDPERRLRIGYVSPDFREHAAAYFIEALLAAHDRAQVDVFCYADLLREDQFTERFKQHAGQWRRISGLKDEQVADLIRQDGIDILVDLAGHTANNRLLVFARKPAPVQVSWLGYPNSTGMRAMDYRLTDAYADPPGTSEQWHSEQLMRLPDGAWCYRPADDAPPVSDAPSGHAGHVTFGCFNARQKINGPLLALWGGILAQVPGSRLVLKHRNMGDASVQEHLRLLLEQSGIAPERVELLGPIEGSAGHLGAYRRVDIALDTFPYHGTTTTCEALWMGVPLVTLAGTTHASRVGVSLLSKVGLPELIARTEEEYVKIACELARDATRRAEVRSKLRERMEASPLMDAPRFARNVENAYRQMWRAWCAQQCSSPTP